MLKTSKQRQREEEEEDEEERLQTKKSNMNWSEYASTLVKALGACNKRINSREDVCFE